MTKLFEEQGAAKYAQGDYTLGMLDSHGQRINIEIQVPGQGLAMGRTSYIKTGWMMNPDGTIKLNTPLAGFTKAKK